jgi:hypothetical protein
MLVVDFRLRTTGSNSNAGRGATGCTWSTYAYTASIDESHATSLFRQGRGVHAGYDHAPRAGR